MKFSYNTVWDYALALLRAHLPLVAAIAGVFIFLPYLLVGYVLPVPQGGGDPRANMEAFITYMGMTWYWHLIAQIVAMLGILAILILVLDQTRPTVGSAISRAVKLLPYYLLASFIVGVGLALLYLLCALPFAALASQGGQIIAFVGSILALTLFVYLWCRTSLLAAVVGLESRMPLDAIRKTLALTHRRGWAILGLYFLIVFAGSIALIAVELVIGSVFRLLLNTDLADFMSLLLSSALYTVLVTVLVVASAAIYRVLGGSESTASLFE